jgi:hypothetical protein
MSESYNMPRPCTGCPFGRHEDAVHNLGARRIIDIADAGGFTCHKTTRETGDGTEKECAGHMIFKLANEGTSQMIRIAGRLGMMSEETFDELEGHAESGAVSFTVLGEVIEVHRS